MSFFLTKERRIDNEVTSISNLCVFQRFLYLYFSSVTLKMSRTLLLFLFGVSVLLLLMMKGSNSKSIDIDECSNKKTELCWCKKRCWNSYITCFDDAVSRHAAGDCRTTREKCTCSCFKDHDKKRVYKRPLLCV